MARLRRVLSNLGPVDPADLADADSALMLQVEAIIVRAAALLEKLPRRVRDGLPDEITRGLVGARNVAAHGYAQLNPTLTAEIVNQGLPAFLDAVDAAIDSAENGGVT